LIHLINSKGCDSSAALNLTVLPATSSLTVVTVCSKMLPYVWNGKDYSQTGIFKEHFINSIGCDSTAILDFKITDIIQNVSDSICANQTYTLPSGRIVNLPGDYYDTLMAKNGCDSIIITSLKVNVLPQINVGNDTIICEGTSINLLPFPNSYKFEWFDGSNSTNHPVSAAGTYWVRAESKKCFYYDTIVINVKKLPELKFATLKDSLCVGDCISINNLSKNIEFWNWQLSGPITLSTPLFDISNLCFPKEGYEEIVLIGGNQCRTDSIIHHVSVGAPQHFLSDDIYIEIGNSVDLTAGNGSLYSWSPTTDLSCADCQITNASPKFTTTYTSEYYNLFGCSSSFTVKVFVLEKEVVVYVPNSFTPNNDGKNDDFRVFGDYIQNYSMVIYNRWGNKIFENKGDSSPWNGTFMNNDCEEGVYPYFIEVNDIFGRKSVLTGSVNLVR
jgi:gliding motility-associated-like protein